jgi:hypothetical protein
LSAALRRPETKKWHFHTRSYEVPQRLTLVMLPIAAISCRPM